MNQIARTVFIREFFSSLFSRSRYVAFALFHALSGAMFCTTLQLAEGKFWTIQTIWTLSVALPLPIIVSLATMPLFAGERASGTFESLEMLPISLGDVAIGKFLASYLSVLLCLAATLVPWFVLCHVLKSRAPDTATLAGPCTLLILHSFSWTALGTFSSAVARHPWVAAAGTLVMGVSLMLLWSAVSHFWLGGNWLSTSFPIIEEILDASGGHLRLHTIVFHIGFGAVALYAAMRSLEANRP
ncbi:MAG: ABC transporter permease subunit [Kiritimatiellae bacterium]|nr:ABC transporter permease subunit [Kiritimatiellia bacterium]